MILNRKPFISDMITSLCKGWIKDGIMRKSKDISTRSIELEEAIRLADEKGTRLVWLGIEPRGKINRIIDVEKDMIVEMDPEELIYSSPSKLRSLENHIFVCYHGRTSKFMSDYLERKHSIHTYHLNGGVVKLADRGASSRP